jgi:hypothetical protein
MEMHVIRKKIFFTGSLLYSENGRQCQIWINRTIISAGKQEVEQNTGGILKKKVYQGDQI